MEHIYMICERFRTIGQVSGRINLSREERTGLIDLSVEGSITCNCERRRLGKEIRDERTLERS